MTTRPGFVEITNATRDTRTLRRIWKTTDGKAPTADEDGNVPDADTFQLKLGGADDDNDEVREHNKDAKDKDKILMPTQLCPTWALNHYRANPLFKNWEATKQVQVSRGA